MPEFTGHRDIRSYIRTIWRWKLLVLVLVVGAPVVGYYLEHRKAPTYAASATVAFTQSAAGSSTSVSIPTGGSIYTTGNIQAIARLITTPSVAQVAGQLMKPPVPGSSIVGSVSASADVSTNFITISVSSGNPVEAADIANAFGKALNVSEDKDTKASLDAAIKSYQSELKNLPRTNANYAGIEQELLADQTAVKTPPNGFTLVDPASPDYTPTGPHARRAAELGLVVGILLAFGAIMMLDSLDRHVRTPDDLEQFTKLPILGAIAPSAFRGDMETTPVDDEAFQTLRTSLTYFTVDEKIKSVLITSPGEQEGKSTIAARLALACAHAGLDVVLVDADLRRAGATAKLGMKTNVGLGLVLAEQRPVETALHEWPISSEDTGRLRVLPAGPPPPNPAALISSQAMRELIRVLENQTDLVIIDSPAALAVSDAVPLMQSVSGVVLVARMHRSKRDTLRRLRKIIDSAHGRLLGAVATGVTTGPGYEKYSQAYYAPIDRNSKRGRKLRKQGRVETPAQSPNGNHASTNGNGNGNVADEAPKVRD